MLACPSSVPAPEQMMFSCKDDVDCRSDEHCNNLQCVKNVDAGGLSADAGPSDANVLYVDAGSVDRLHVDSALVDLAPFDVVHGDAMTDAGTDAGVEDAAHSDVSRNDGPLADQGPEDRSFEDQGVADQDLADQSVQDTAPQNQPPTIQVDEAELWTYASSAHHAWTVTTAYHAEDPDNDLVKPVFVSDAAAACSFQTGHLVYHAPPGFVGDAHCVFYAEEIASGYLQSVQLIVTIHVLAARASCYRVLQDEFLKEKWIGQISGLYQIDPDGLGGRDAFEAYCDQETEGGGWTLALAALNSDSNYDLRYDSDFWASGTEGLVHLPQQSAPRPTIHHTAKFMPYNRLPFSEVMIGMISEEELAASQGQMHYLPRDISGASLQTTFAELLPDWTPWKQWDGDAWNSLLSGAQLQDHCRFEGFHVSNYPELSTKARLGIIANNEADCSSNDSALGIGLAFSGGDGVAVGFADTNESSAISAYGIVYVRDSKLPSLQVRASCMAHRLAGEDVDGLYVVDPVSESWPPPFTAFCDMHSHGGGWTLLTVNGETPIWEDWGVSVFFDPWSLSSPQLEDDFRSRAMLRLGVNDLLFAAADNVGDDENNQWMLYRDAVNNETFYDYINQFREPVCSMDSANSSHMSAGHMSATSMCDHSLYLSPQDQDGSNNCDDDNNAYGPGWSVAANNGCPMDDPEESAFRDFASYGHHPFHDSSAIQAWGRETDFSRLHYASSCQAHFDAGHDISGQYTIQQSPMGMARRAYCLMDRDAGQGWERIAHFDVGYMNDCPGDLQFSDNPRACWGHLDNDQGGVRSAVFAVPGSYQHVRGFVRALQQGSTDAYFRINENQIGINETYVDGIDLSHGQGADRGHLWTYAVGLDHDGNDAAKSSRCPCNDGHNVADFVHSNQYCDSALQNFGNSSFSKIFISNPLFDGINSACGETADPLWFERDLARPISDAIELRLMLDQNHDDEDIGLTALELYVR